MIPANLKDPELLARFVENGDEAAYSELVARHGRMVFNLARRITGSAHDAEDTVQKVFTALAERAIALREHKSVAGWLYSTAWHIASRDRRADARRRRREHAAASLRQTERIESELAEDVVYELFRALEMLPPEHRALIVLHHLEGVRVEDLAELTEEPLGTVAARLSRGRAMIRERMARRGQPLTAAQLLLYFGNELRGMNAVDTPEPLACVAPPVDAPLCAATTSQACAAAAPLVAPASGSAGKVLLGLLNTRIVATATVLVVLCGASAAPASRQWVQTASDWVRAKFTSSEPKRGSTGAKTVVSNLPAIPTSYSASSYSVVPEPGAAATLVIGTCCLALRRRGATSARRR